MSDSYHRIAIVTGATSGIGEAIVQKFVTAGFGVVGNGRNKEKLDLLEHTFGPAFCGVSGDAAGLELIDSLFNSALDHFKKPVDIVVANAGRGLGGSIKDADLSEVESLLNINVAGTLTLLQKAAREMTDSQQKGFPDTASDIVVIGSVVGRNVSPFSAIYGATKFAVHSLTEALRREVCSMGVRVSLIEPGFVHTGFQAGAGYSDEMVSAIDEKFGPVLKSDDIADAIHYVVTRPPHVHVADIVVRPTRQDYP